MKIWGWISLALCCLPGIAQSGVLIFAAASMKPALDQLVEEAKDIPIRISYAGSSTLARQIIAGAPADIYISANREWMSVVEAEQAIQDLRVIATNRLVVAGHKVTTVPDRWADLIGPERLAVAQVQSVPAGIYAKQALQARGLWASLEPFLAQTDHVRAAQILLERGEVPLAILYASDIHEHADLVTVDMFERQEHDPIQYPAALLTQKSDARAFFDLLIGEQGQKALKSAGFTPYEETK